ncbi:MAG: LemA family protein [Clostridia bacterium]|nr:LemA family protein [Clostridia bacterium]
MEISTIIFLLILAVFVIMIVIYFNKLVKALDLNREAFYNVDIVLKKRLDLIPSLEEIVKNYDILNEKSSQKLLELRESLKENLSVSRRQKLEDKLSDIIKEIFINIEKYPNVKQEQSFIDIKEELAKIEGEIEITRKEYNEATRNYNLIVKSFPTNILAKLFSFKKSSYFEVDLLTRDNIIEKSVNENYEIDNKEN